jgi:hypothetical protein
MNGKRLSLISYPHFIMQQFYKIALVISLISMLACGSTISGGMVTPTPTKTSTPVEAELPTETPTPIQIILPTVTPIPTDTSTPTPTPTDTSTSTPIPPTDTSTPELPTDTPTSIPLPPTNTPQSAPPTNTPVPAEPVETEVPEVPTPVPVPVQRGPEVTIELPDGDTHPVGARIKIVITVRDPEGVSAFSWGVFAQNRTPLAGGDKNCSGATECSITEEVDAILSGQFEVGVEAKNKSGAGTIETKQLYIG